LDQTRNWQSALDEAAQALRLDIVDYRDDINDKIAPRYFHADCRSDQTADGVKWRLKVPNAEHADIAGIRNCLANDHLVLQRLSQISRFRPFARIPTCFPIRPEWQPYCGCCELISGRKAETRDIPLVVRTLVDIRASWPEIADQLPHPARGMNRFDRTIYRSRLVDVSGRSLVTKQVLNKDELEELGIRFDGLFPHDLPQQSAAFVHGDYSLGNLLVSNGEVCLIDFEHSHIGLAAIDLAHLYVNLVADKDVDNANQLLDTYRSGTSDQGLDFNESIFQALVLERAAGKLNAMHRSDDDQVETLKKLLVT